LIIICSREAFGHQYLVDALNKELNLELETGRDDLLVPVCVDDEAIALWKEYNEKNKHKKEVHDFRQWLETDSYKKAVQELIDALKATENGKGSMG
jgi:hypothetical protein